MRNGSLLVLSLLVTLFTPTPFVAGLPQAAAAKLPFELNGKTLFVQVSIAGIGPFSFVLDSGAQASLLDALALDTLGLTGEEGGNVLGAGGVVRGTTLRDLTFELGGARFVIPDLTAVPLTSIAKNMGRRVDGVLGADLFLRFTVEIDFEKKELTLYEPSAFEYRGRGEVLPLTFHDNLPYIHAKVKLPGARAAEGEFVIDSGSNFPLILLPAFLDAHGLQGSVPPTLPTFGRGVGGEVSLPLGRAGDLTIGGFSVPQPVTAFPREGNFARIGKSGNIGAAILSRFKVTFDYAHARMMLEPNASFAEPFECDMSGLALLAETPDFRKVRVHRVLAKSPAQEGGVRADDEIVSVGGRPVSKLGLVALREMLRKPGNRLALEVRRGGELVPLQFTTRRML